MQSGQDCGSHLFAAESPPIMSLSEGARGPRSGTAVPRRRDGVTTPRKGAARRGDLRVTRVCFAVGYSSLGTFSTRFAELIGMPSSTHQRNTAHATAGIPPCVADR